MAEPTGSGSPDPERDNQNLRALALVANLGFRIALPMIVAIGGGAFLDENFRTSPWLLIGGAVLGTIIAFYELYDATRTT